MCVNANVGVCFTNSEGMGYPCVSVCLCIHNAVWGNVIKHKISQPRKKTHEESGKEKQTTKQNVLSKH